MSDSEKTVDGTVYVLPCSGIGKAMASVGRNAAYALVEDLRPGNADTLCLSLVTLGDEDATRAVRENRVITIDGCAKDCARKNVEAAGGHPDVSHRVLDFLKEHRDLKPESVLDVGEGGRKLTALIAERLAGEVDTLLDGRDGDE